MKKVLLILTSLSSVCLTGCWGNCLDEHANVGTNQPYPTAEDFLTVREHMMDYNMNEECDVTGKDPMCYIYPDIYGTELEDSYVTSLYLTEEDVNYPYFSIVSNSSDDSVKYSNVIYLSKYNSKLAGIYHCWKTGIWVDYDIFISNYNLESINILYITDDEGYAVDVADEFKEAIHNLITSSINFDLMNTINYFSTYNLPFVWSSNGEHNCEYRFQTN